MKPTPIAIVVDRSFEGRVSESIKQLGGSWIEMFDTWRHSGFKYVVMLAHTRERIRKRAPLTMLADSDDNLHTAIRNCCAQLSDVKCRWLLCVESGSSADAIVRAEVFADSIVEGRA
jgi:hypothetical protein